MAYMTNMEIWSEMARRKIQFNLKKDWDKISLWGLFRWSAVKRMLNSGLLKISMCKENQTVWVQPSKEAWEKYIKPLVDNHTLDELLVLSGWT